MNPTSKELLIRSGVQVDEALERFMGNEALLERFLRKFPDDPNLAALEAAVASGDRQGAFTAAHTLKGVCGNLSLKDLAQLYSQQVELLRAGDWDQGAAMTPRIAAAHRSVSAAIRAALG